MPTERGSSKRVEDGPPKPSVPPSSSFSSLRLPSISTLQLPTDSRHIVSPYPTRNSRINFDRARPAQSPVSPKFASNLNTRDIAPLATSSPTRFGSSSRQITEIPATGIPGPSRSYTPARRTLPSLKSSATDGVGDNSPALTSSRSSSRIQETRPTLPYASQRNYARSDPSITETRTVYVAYTDLSTSLIFSGGTLIHLLLILPMLIPHALRALQPIKTAHPTAALGLTSGSCHSVATFKLGPPRRLSATILVSKMHCVRCRTALSVLAVISVSTISRS